MRKKVTIETFGVARNVGTIIKEMNQFKTACNSARLLSLRKEHGFKAVAQEEAGDWAEYNNGRCVSATRAELLDVRL